MGIVIRILEFIPGGEGRILGKSIFSSGPAGAVEAVGAFGEEAGLAAGDDGKLTAGMTGKGHRRG